MNADMADFPYRKYYMPAFSDMFNRLKNIANNPPKEWSNNTYKCQWGIVERTYPKDYEKTDSLADHFVEEARIICREQNYVSPIEAWVKYKNSLSFDPTKMIYENREEVYKRARGCNLFNTSLGVYALKRIIDVLPSNKFDKNNISVLDCTAGWGDRLIAAFATPNVKFYRGWDTNPNLQLPYKQISDACKNAGAHTIDWQIQCSPFEETIYFNKGQAGFERFDIVLTSPPFYNQEIYTGSDTSILKYKTFKHWIADFYKPMLIRAKNALKPGGYIALYLPMDLLAITDKILYQLRYRGCLGFRLTFKDAKPSPIRTMFIWEKI